MSDIERLLEAAKADDAAAKVQAILEASTAAAREGVDAKNRQLLAELAPLKAWRTLEADGVTVDSVREMKEKLEAAELKLEAGKRGVKHGELEKLASEEATRQIAVKVKDWEAEKGRLTEQLAAAAERAGFLESRHLETCQEFDLYKAAGHMIDPIMWKYFVQEMAPSMKAMPAQNGDGDQPWYHAKKPVFKLMDGDTPIQGEKGPMLLPELMASKVADEGFSARFVVQQGQGGGASSAKGSSGKPYDWKAPARNDLEDAY